MPLRSAAFLLLAVYPAAFALPTSVAESVASAECEQVIDALPSPGTDEARLAVGWCQLQLGRATTAREILGAMEQADTDDSVFHDYARLLIATSLLASDSDAAVEMLNGLDLPGPARREIQLLRGTALVNAGRSLEARDGLRDLLETDAGGQARYLLARGGEDRGDLAAATATYERTWATSTRGPWAELAVQRLVGLESQVPDLTTERGRELMATRRDALVRDNQHGEAHDLTTALIGTPSTAGERLQLAKSAFKARKYDEAVVLWQDIVGPPQTASGSPNVLFDLALAFARMGDYATAEVVYRRLIEQHPSHSLADQASFKLGYMAWDGVECARARELFTDHLGQFTSSNHTESARWFRARCAWSAGDVQSAVEDWLAVEGDGGSLASGARYWRARAAGKQGDPEAMAQGLRDVLRRWPTSGYAWFSAQTLNEQFDAAPAYEAPSWPEHFASRRDVRRATALLNAGFTRWAAAELASALPAANGEKAAALAAAHMLLRAGDYANARVLASPWCSSPHKGGDPAAMAACYPLAEQDVVFPIANGFDLEPLLPYAIMKAESNLDPSVTSIAGARGLMQLMPAEGPRVHQAAFGNDHFDADNLYTAPYNAAMGTTELGLKRQSIGDVLEGNSLPAWIASYNGGEEAVRRWLSDDEVPPAFDEFAEDISYSETRRYVRNVLGHLMALRWVHGDQVTTP